MQKNWFYYTIALYCTQENITVLTTKNKKEQSIHILELFFYFRSPRSINITVSCSFVLRSFHIPRACLKNHSCNLHAPICGRFCLHSVDVARYAALIQAKSPANCNVHLTESIFQTRSKTSSLL